jgi:glucokinase
VTRVLAVDIGGTKLSAGVVSSDGTLNARRDTATVPNDDPDGLFATLADLVTSVLAGAGPLDACGVGCGGPMDAGGEHVSPVNIPAWRGFPLRARLASVTGLPVFVDNDAKALALGEGWLGAAAGVRDYVGMVVSTGVGGGIVLDGRLLDGDTGNAGHIGHVIVEPDGHRCGCGAYGCLEAEASGTAIAKITGAPPKDAPAESVARTGRLVGRAVASVANLLDLHLAVVAGSVALGYGEPFFAAAQTEIDARCRLDYVRDRVRIVPAKLGPDAPLIGAARVALTRL